MTRAAAITAIRSPTPEEEVLAWAAAWTALLTAVVGIGVKVGSGVMAEGVTVGAGVGTGVGTGVAEGRAAAVGAGVAIVCGAGVDVADTLPPFFTVSTAAFVVTDLFVEASKKVA